MGQGMPISSGHQQVLIESSRLMQSTSPSNTKHRIVEGYPGKEASTLPNPSFQQAKSACSLPVAAPQSGEPSPGLLRQRAPKQIAIAGRTKAALLETKELIEHESEGVSVTPIVVDVTSHKAVEDTFKSCGTVDIHVNNAGFMPDLCRIKDSPLDKWWQGFEINVKGTFIVSQAFLKVASARAALINITAGLVHMNVPLPGQSSYVSSRMASAKFFQMLQQEYPLLRVMNIHPGVIQSAMLE
ncbi:MAG: hypothetical protein Q9226_002149 [Calogaya cf. arnoldii]